VKDSYFVTPRTLGQCQFSGDADPIDRPDQAHAGAPVAWFAVFLALILVASVLVWAR